MDLRRSALKTMIAMAIVTVLVTVAIPIYNRALTRSKESMLKNNLFALRIVIQEYTHDEQEAPETLEDLVRAGYLCEVPMDPVSAIANWKLDLIDQTKPGIFGVQSSSEKISLEGTRYSDW
jgi:general secretion pathway protein G